MEDEGASVRLIICHLDGHAAVLHKLIERRHPLELFSNTVLHNIEAIFEHGRVLRVAQPETGSS